MSNLITTCKTCQAEILDASKGCLTCTPPAQQVAPQAPSKLALTLFFCGLAVAVFYLFGFLSDRDTNRQIAKDKREADVNACVNRGIAYFKDTGSYPYLQSDGRDAKQVAEERCRRGLTAF